MKFLSVFIFLSLHFYPLIAQDITGQWKGFFTNEASGNSAAQTFNYTVDLKQQGKHFIGTSYSFYNEGTKKYYSICTVVAKRKAGTNIVEIWETKRTKTNNNSSYSGLQYHKLLLNTTNNKESLTGTWDYVYDDNTLQGNGKTKLDRNTKQNTLGQITKAIEKQKTDIARLNNLKLKTEADKLKNKLKDSSSLASSVHLTSISSFEAEKKTNISPNIYIPEKLGSYANYQSRKKNIIRTFYTASSSLTIDIYDNGEIDGDSITLLFNDRILLLKQMLRAKPISFMLQMDPKNQEGSELVMYAENLGTIPPNTALMIITDEKKRYEVRVSSDLMQSGAIRFVPQKPKE